MGGLAAFGLSFFLIWFLKVTNFEGGAGYFTSFVILTGVAGGFVVGLITALTMRSTFTQRCSRIREPKLDGDSIRLEVELKCPRD
jgi:hypothetical protein